MAIRPSEDLEDRLDAAEEIQSMRKKKRRIWDMKAEGEGEGAEGDKIEAGKESQ